MRSVLLLGSIVGALLLTLAIGASRLLMIDQGDYPRTVSRVLSAPVEVVALPHSRPVGQQWRLHPSASMRPNLSSGSASMAFHVLALAQTPIGVYDVRKVGLVFGVLTGLGLALVAVLLSRGAGTGVRTGLAAAALVLPLLLASHNSAFLTSFYGEFAFVVAAPWLLAALLMTPSRWRSVLLFVSVAVATLAKAQNIALPALLLGIAALASVLASLARRFFPARIEALAQRIATAFDPRLRRLDVAGLLAVQVMAMVMVAKGDYGHYNAHHAAYLGAFFVVSEAEVRASGIEPPSAHCIGVDRWGNQLPAADSVAPVLAAPDCRAPPRLSMTDVLRLYAQSPTALVELAREALPVHATVDYFHLSPDVRYIHAVEPMSATRVLKGVSRFRDAAIHGNGVVIVPTLFVLVAAALAFGRYRHVAFPLALLGLYAVSQVGVSLLGEGVRDLSKHLAMGQYAIDLGLALLVAIASSALVLKLTSAARAASTPSSRAR